VGSYREGRNRVSTPSLHYRDARDGASRVVIYNFPSNFARRVAREVSLQLALASSA